jgi:thioredoxin-related protein
MRRGFLKTTLLALLMTLSLGAVEIEYKDDYKVALKEANTTKKYLFVMVTKPNCRWCKKLKQTTLQDEAIKENLNKNYVAVELERFVSYYPKSMKVLGVPSIFIIDPKSGEIITNIVGYREDTHDYLKWFGYVENLEE